MPESPDGPVSRWPAPSPRSISPKPLLTTPSNAPLASLRWQGPPLLRFTGPAITCSASPDPNGLPGFFADGDNDGTTPAFLDSFSPIYLPDSLPCTSPTASSSRPTNCLRSLTVRLPVLPSRPACHER